MQHSCTALVDMAWDQAKWYDINLFFPRNKLIKQRNALKHSCSDCGTPHDSPHFVNRYQYKNFKVEMVKKGRGVNVDHLVTWVGNGQQPPLSAIETY